ncbi:DUF1499 domain-containing protein [Candidatus Phycosocius spiralis]|uniref:DUF1499 domain-containing protein n=1 Tax=Candidatus Phycosocius spiralis TaxID=2815099 RepID=A0ABQ4PTK0_9PROT|nr:DUF1499 domain-containing protein [Candidatus Phycosocius spiralis]GIU66310.1 hypothetical protein PsB1_0464 [Candidatus Phycosocius spiralis]
MISDFPLDFAHFKKTWRPNQFLALPSSFKAVQEPDMLSPSFKASATEVMEAWQEVLLKQPRVSKIRQAGLQIEVIQKTPLVGFPDWITAQGLDLGDAMASICVFSRSKYGVRDFGVNEKRVRLWLSWLAQKLALAD